MDESLFTVGNPPGQCLADNQADLFPTMPEMTTGDEGANYYEKVNDNMPYRDDDWVVNSFMVRSEDMGQNALNNRFSSAADHMFTDTTLGGSLSINVAPQFTLFADTRAGGVLSGRKPVTVMDMTGNTGIGRNYATVIEENSLDLYFEFGYIAFNNVLYYLLSAVDYRTSVIANTGRSPLAYDAGVIAGVGALLVAFPLITIGALAAKAVFKITTTLFASPGRFAHNYLKPAMYDYWSSANVIATLFATELGFVAPSMGKASDGKSSRIGAPLQLHNDELEAIRELMPGLLTTANGINMQAMVSRAQIMAATYRKQRLLALDNFKSTDFTKQPAFYRIDEPKMKPGTVKPSSNSEGMSNNKEVKADNGLWSKLKPLFKDNIDVMAQNTSEDMTKFTSKLPKSVTEFVDKLEKAGGGLATTASKDMKYLKSKYTETTNALFTSDKEGTYSRGTRVEDDHDYLKTAMKVATAVYNEGARYLTLRVEHTGSYTTTFSNSTTSIGTGETVNGLGSKLREAKYTFGGMQVPVVSDVIKSVADLAVGALDGVTLGMAGAIGSFLAGADINPEKRWDSSSISLPTHTFKIQLRCPSAHPLVQLRGLYMPLSAIIAAVAPKSTGPNSHTTPYHCNMFGRGQLRIDRGMITNVSITAGAGNLGFNKQGRSLGFDVSITVLDFSETISTPTGTDILSTGSILYDDEAGLNKLVQAFTARDLVTHSHALTRAKLKFSKFLQGADLILDPAYLGARAGDLLVGYSLGNKTLDYTEIYQ